jgi:hypothetical protein
MMDTRDRLEEVGRNIDANKGFYSRQQNIIKRLYYSRRALGLYIL